MQTLPRSLRALAPVLAAFAMAAASGSSTLAATETPEARPPWSVEIFPETAAGLALVGETARYTVVLENRTDTAAPVELTLRRSPLGGGAAQPEDSKHRFQLSPRVPQKFLLELPAGEPGYTILDASLATPAGDLLARAESALAVVTPQPHKGQLDPAGFFGLHYASNLEAAARLGARALRIFVPWRPLEPKRSAYDWTSLDSQVDAARAAGIEVMLCLRPEELPRWAPWKSLEELVQPDHLPEFARFTRAVLERYRGKLVGVEIVNEPNLACHEKSTGKIPATEIYARLLKTGYEAARSVDPKLPVIGLSNSGGDWPGLAFARGVLDRQPRHLDINGFHPYSGARWVGGENRPESPLAMRANARLAKIADLMADYGLPRRVWATEWGWAIRPEESMHSPAMQLYSAYVAHALILAREVPEVEKVFWFGMFWPRLERGATYGLFRTPMEAVLWDQKYGTRNYYNVDRRIVAQSYPTPAAATYATCARLLHEVKFVRNFWLGSFCYVTRFADHRREKNLFIVWVEQPEALGGGTRLKFPWERFPAASLTSGLGREIPPGPMLELDAVPVFISVPAAEADAFERALKAAEVEGRQSLFARRAWLATDRRIQVEVVNATLRPYPVKLHVAGRLSSSRSRTLPVGASILDVPLAAPSPRQGRVVLELLDERSGQAQQIPVEFDLQPVPRLRQPVRLDGVLDEVRGRSPMVADRRDDVLPADPGVDWKGPDDLSLQVWPAWTEQGIYLGVKVRDDVHQANAGASPWHSDSLQVAFDVGLRADIGYDEHCRELNFMLADGRSLGAESHPQGGSRDGLSRIVRHDDKGETLYELFIPWERLGRVLQPGEVFAFNLIANDNDGKGRKCWVGLSPGIGEGKRPSAWRRWIIEEKP